MSLVDHTHWTGVTGTSIPVDMSLATLILVMIASVNTPGSITDTQSHSYSPLSTIQSGARFLQGYYLTGAAGAFSNVLQLTLADGAAMNAVVGGFNPVAPTNFAESTGGTSATASVQSANALSAGGAPNLIFSGLGGDANTSITTPAGYTVVDNVTNTPYGPQGVGLAWIEQAANTSQQPTWNVGSNGSALETALFSFRFTASGGVTVAQESGIFDQQRSGGIIGQMWAQQQQLRRGSRYGRYAQR